MSIARALTKRYRAQQDDVPDSPRSFGSISSRKGDRFPTINRAQISLPVELLSTTNVLAYDAPDIHPINTSSPLSAVSSSSSRKSYEDDSSPGLSSSSSVSSAHMSRESSPILPEPNHLSNYFMPHGKHASVPKPQEQVEPEIPSLPARALSHTKKTHQALARKRSQSHMSNPSNASSTLSHDTMPASPTSIRKPSFDFATKPESNHPFGAELAQVNELAEEFGVTENVRIWDEDEQFLIANGLHKYGVEEYISEIESLLVGVFDDSSAGGWL